MAAGSFLVENKVRPGCYIQIKGVPKASSVMSERGTVAILMNADSGDLVTEISANDILTGASAAKGFPLSEFTDENSILHYVYPYVNKIILGRLNAGGAKAATILELASESTLTVTAKFSGVYGNSISVMIVKEKTGEGKFGGGGYFVRTSYDGEVVDEQNVESANTIVDNDYVTFAVEGGGVLVEVAAEDLTGGTNGTESGTNLTGILSKLSGMPWNTLGYCGENTNRAVVSTYIKDLRENKGKYRQAVLYTSANEDYEGIISPNQGFVLDGEDPSEWNATKVHERGMWAVAFVAALTAGADVYVSNTYHVLPSNVVSVYPVSEEDAEVETELRRGAFLFTHNSSGELVVEKDINTLHTYTQTRTPPFSKNRVIRTLDEISNTKVLVWETQFIGKVDNDDLGRALLKGQILKILDDFASIGAVARNDYDVTVEPGDDPDKVRSYEQLRPIDSMEQLYSYVTVLG